MMERLICIGIGFVIAVALICVYHLAKDVLEDRKALNDVRIKSLATAVCLEITRDIRWYNIKQFDERVGELIDSKLAEKEVENENT